MTPTLTNFLACLKTLGVSPAYDYAASAYVNNAPSSPSITIPAKHDSVGHLKVYDDGDELTVELGELHHAHFSAYNYDAETGEQRLLSATEDAAKFVADILDDRVFISIDYSAERCIGSSHGYLDSASQPTDLVRLPDAPLFHNECTRSERYVWSGPIDIET